MSRRRRLLPWIVLLAMGTSARAWADACPEGELPQPAIDNECTKTRTKAQALVPDLDVLKSPSSPAFAALDLNPSAVDHPGTPTGAALALAAGLSRGFLSPGQNVAIDFSPYWLVLHPDLTARAIEATPWSSAIRNFSLSLATTSGKLSLPDSTGTVSTIDVGRMAVGARTTVYPGTLSRAARACGQVVDDFTRRDATADAAAKARFVAGWDRDHPIPKAMRTLPAPRPEDFPNDVDAFEQANNDWMKAMSELNADFDAARKTWNATRAAAIDEWRAALKKSNAAPDDVAECMDVMHHREGFVLDAAGAMVWNLPGGEVSRLNEQGSRTAMAWLTGGFVWTRDLSQGSHAWDFSVLAVFRERWQTFLGNDTTGHQTDMGARVVFAIERWGVSIEGLRTAQKSVPDDNQTNYRVAAVVDYHLKSGVWLTVTGGADLNNEGKSTHPIGLMNFNANFGPERLVTPDQPVLRGGSGAQP